MLWLRRTKNNMLFCHSVTQPSLSLDKVFFWIREVFLFAVRVFLNSVPCLWDSFFFQETYSTYNLSSPYFLPSRLPLGISHPGQSISNQQLPSDIQLKLTINTFCRLELSELAVISVLSKPTSFCSKVFPCYCCKSNNRPCGQKQFVPDRIQVAW